jgi:exosortase A-associated hydrolase 1
MRFDYRGMGDSEGSMRNFEEIRTDIHAAIDHFCIEVPELREVVIWGLCDAASAALMEGYRDNRVIGLVLLNPWVRTLEGFAKTQLKHYYWSRLTDWEFWRKLVHGEFAVAASVRSFAGALKLAFGLGGVRGAPNGLAATLANNISSKFVPLPTRMADGMSRFKGKVLLILSGNDLTAQEFEGVVRESHRWRSLLADARVESRKISEANHTFSRAEWREQVAVWTIEWVQSC